MPPRPILRVGLTGNIASGKSTVSAWLAELGCHVTDLDALGHRCLEPGEPPYDEVIEAFGNEIVGEGGAIDRRRLSRLVFADAEARARLEAIVHPRILRQEQEVIDRWAATQEKGIAVTEAALIYETGSADRYHRMVVVLAPDDVRLSRLTSSGLPPDEARQRMASQMDQDHKAELADYVIDNGGDLAATRSQVERLRERLGDDLESLIGGRRLPPGASA